MQNLEGSYYDATTGAFHDFVLQRDGATWSVNGWQHPLQRHRHLWLMDAAYEIRRRYVIPTIQPVYPFLGRQLQPLATFLEQQGGLTSLGNVVLVWPDFDQQYPEHVKWFVTLLPAEEPSPKEELSEENCGLLPDLGAVKMSEAQTQSAMSAADAVIAAWNRERSVSY